MIYQLSKHVKYLTLTPNFRCEGLTKALKYAILLRQAYGLKLSLSNYKKGEWMYKEFDKMSPTTVSQNSSWEWILILLPFLVILFWGHPKKALWGTIPRRLYKIAGAAILIAAVIQIGIVAAVRTHGYDDQLLHDLCEDWKWPYYGLHLIAMVLYLAAYITRRRERRAEEARLEVKFRKVETT